LWFGGYNVGVHSWSIAEAKARFSEVIEKARCLGPQTITRNGRRAAVVVAPEEWERKTRRKGSLAEFFAASPLGRSGLKINRVRGGIRKPGL
jgi:prevent-host-death family protein